MIRPTVAAVLLTTLAAGAQPAGDAFTIARVHYDGGGGSDDGGGIKPL